MLHTETVVHPMNLVALFVGILPCTSRHTTKDLAGGISKYHQKRSVKWKCMHLQSTRSEDKYPDLRRGKYHARIREKTKNHCAKNLRVRNPGQCYG